MSAISRECQRKAGTHDGGAEGSRKTPRSGTKRDHGSLAEGFSEGVEGAAAQGEGTDSGGGIAGAQKKVGGLLLGRRRRLTSAVQRRMAIELIVEASSAGARLVSACCELGISLRSLKCWRRAFGSDEDGEDRRIGSSRLVSHCLSEEERQRILLTCNQPEYASLPPGQIMPILDDRGLYNSFGEDCVYGSERSFYRDLHKQGQVQCLGRARPPQEPRPVPRLEARAPNQLWSQDITYLLTSVCGVWLYLRINKGRRQPLILHADNGNAMRAATLESRLEELGVLRSFSRPRVSNDNPYTESLFRIAKYRPDYPSRPFASKAEGCEWIAVSSLSRLTNAIAVPSSPSAGDAPRSTKRLARPTQNAGANPLAAGVNQ